MEDACQVRPIAIYYLEFDDENISHVSGHGITPEEIEQVTGNAFVTARNPSGPENRIFMIGFTDGGRALTVVLEATRDDVVWRPITGWDSTSRERTGIVLSVRLKPDEAELLRALAERDGRTLSDTLRIALHAFARQPPREVADRGEVASLTRGGVFVNQPADMMFC